MEHNKDVVFTWGVVCDIPHWIGEKVFGDIYVWTSLNSINTF